MICKECNAEISGDICPNCGYKNTSKSKKVILGLTIAIIVVAIIVASFIVFSKTNDAKNITLFVTEGQAFSKMISNSKSNLTGIGTLYLYSTKQNTGYGWDEEYFTNYVTGLCASDISEEKTNMLNIKTQYESIKEIEYSNDKIKELKKQTDNLYNAYEDMYDLLIEQNFTYKNFESKYIQMNNELEMALELYNSILEELDGK